MVLAKNAAFATFIIILAEIIWRLLRVLKEYKLYSKHYPIDRKFRTAFTHGFTFTDHSLYILCITIAIVLNRFHSPSILFESILEQCYLLPIWWIFRYVRLTDSMFNYTDLIRSDTGLDYATGMAANYFHGYLKLTLPNFNEQKGIVERIETYESRHHVQFASKRLFILIPNSLHSRPIIKSPLMERQDDEPLEDVRNDRAGVSRPYRNDVYRICIDGKPYYISAEGATPLQSFYDAFNFDMTSTWQMKVMKKEILLKFYKYLKKILEECPDTQGQCELVFYNDYTLDGKPQDVGEILCMHIKQMWAREEEQKQQKAL